MRQGQAREAPVLRRGVRRGRRLTLPHAAQSRRLRGFSASHAGAAAGALAADAQGDEQLPVWDSVVQLVALGLQVLWELNRQKQSQLCSNVVRDGLEFTY